MNKINATDLFRINESILKRVNRELTYHGLETAYIVYKILSKLDYNKSDIYTITMLAFLHDIGAYNTDVTAELEQYRSSETINHSIYGYELLKHFDLFGDEGSMILYHHHSYKDKDKLVNSIKIKDEAFLIALGDTISLALNLFKYKEDKVIDHIKNLDKDRFKKLHFVALSQLIDEGLIKELISGEYKSFLIKELSVNINISNNRLKKYIVLLPLSIDFFSFETSIHTVGVYCITKKLCEKLNIEKAQIESIKMGALLHDLGKICIPKQILEKEGRLSTEEFETMKKHVLYTRDILEDAKINSDIVNLACSHHEKLNGKGYPLGIKNKDLTVGDRIVTISDIFCALTEKRHYKQAFSKDKVIKILLDMVSKNEIDNDISTILIENYDDILEYYEKERNYFINKLKNMLNDYEEIYRKMDELIIV